MPFMDRDSFIRLLNQLGDTDDATVLDCARTIHRRMQEAGVAWEDLLVPPPGRSAPLPDAVEDDDPLAAANDDGLVDFPVSPAATGPGGAEDVARLERLLARPDISATTKRELVELKRDIATGDFTHHDSKYLRDLEARLGGLTAQQA